MSTASNRGIQIRYLHPLKPTFGQAKLEFVCGDLSLRTVSAVGPPIYPPGHRTTGIWLGAYPVSVFIDTKNGGLSHIAHVDHFCLKEPFEAVTMRTINSIAFEYNLRLRKRKS